MITARTLAKRSRDPRYKVGTVVVSKDNPQILAVGYNGDHAGGRTAGNFQFREALLHRRHLGLHLLRLLHDLA